MSYTATLQMPSNYVLMNEEEKTYLEGGYRATRQVYIPAHSIRMSKQDYMNAQYAKTAVASVIIAIATGGVGIALALKPAESFALGVAGSVLSLLGGTGFSTAEKLDRADGSYDGMLTVSWDEMWKTETNPYPPNSYEGSIF